MIREAVYKITESCPCDCTFCDSNYKYNYILKKKILSYEEWVKITDKLVESGLEVVVLSGGEPLVESETTIKLIDYLHQNNVFVVLNASGALFKNSKNLLLKLTEHFPDLLVFSVDSIDPKKHDNNRRLDGVFDSVVSSIKYLKALGDFPIAIRTVITRSNYREIPEIIRYFSSLGVDCIKLTNIENDTDKEFILRKEELDEFNDVVKPKIISELKKCSYESYDLLGENIKKINNLLSKDNDDYLSIAEGIFSPKLVGNAPCDLNGRFFAVQSNGDVLPCCEAEHHYTPLLGNILRQEEDEIKRSDIYLDFTQKREDYCRTCTQKHNLQLDFKTRIKKVDRR